MLRIQSKNYMIDYVPGAKSLMESFEQTASADNLTTNEAKQTVEAMVNNVLSEVINFLVLSKFLRIYNFLHELK